MINLANQIAQTWWAWMGSMFWQVSLLILIIGVIDILIRKWAWPQVRYALWLLVLLKLLIPPSWSLPSSIIPRFHQPAQDRIIQQWNKTFQIPVDKGMAVQTATPYVSKSSLVREPATGKPSMDKTAESPSKTTKVKPGWQVYALGIWILGMGLFLALLMNRMKKLRRWHKEQEERKTIPVWFHKLLVQTAKRLKMGQLPAIVFSDQAVTPAVYGAFHPVLLLPADYIDSLSHEEAEHVLLHELAHLKRGDLWLHGICLLLQIIYWFNPLMVWMRRKMKHVREMCCDLTIANILREKTMNYRKTLLNTARELLTESVEPGMGLLGVFEEPFRLVARLKWLEKKTWQKRKLVLATACGVTLMMMACILPMAGVKKESTPARLSSRPESMKQEEKDFLKNLILPVTIKKIDPVYAAVLPIVGSTDQFEDAVSKLRKLLNDSGIKPKGHPFGLSLSNPEKVPEEQFSWLVGFPVKFGTKVELPLEILRVSEQQIASATIEGIKNTESVWPQFIEVIEERGYVPAFPPAVEIWSGTDVGKDFWWRTEIQIQVFQAEKEYPGLEIALKETEPFSAVVLPIQGSYAQLPEAMVKLKNYVRQKRIKTIGDPFAQYYSDATRVPPPLYIWEVGYPVEIGAEIDPPFEIRQIEKAMAASAVVSGPPGVEYPWAPLAIQMIIKGYMPVGPAMEIWSGDPKKSGKKGPRTEMRVPVIKMEEFGEAMAEWGQEFAETMSKWGKDFAKEMTSSKEGRTEAKELRAIIDSINSIISRAMVAGDHETILSYYTDDCIYKPNFSPMLKGKKTLREQMKESQKLGLKFHSFTGTILDIWDCGDQVYEIGTYGMSFSTTDSSYPIPDEGKYFTIWQKKPDGSYKIRFTMWNTNISPLNR